MRLPRSGQATSVDSADTSDAILMARVSSFAARDLPRGKCSEFHGLYLADNVHLQWTVARVSHSVNLWKGIQK